MLYYTDKTNILSFHVSIREAHLERKWEEKENELCGIHDFLKDIGNITSNVMVAVSIMKLQRVMRFMTSSRALDEQD